MAQPVVHFEICCKDHQKGKEFYSKLFDWKTSEFEGGIPYSLVESGGDKAIGGGIMGTDGSFPTYVTFYVQVDDLQQYLTKAEEMGGKIVQPPTPIPGMGSSAMFSDPDGNCIGLFMPGK